MPSSSSYSYMSSPHHPQHTHVDFLRRSGTTAKLWGGGNSWVNTFLQLTLPGQTGVGLRDIALPKRDSPKRRVSSGSYQSVSSLGTVLWLTTVRHRHRDRKSERQRQRQRQRKTRRGGGRARGREERGGGEQTWAERRCGVLKVPRALKCRVLNCIHTSTISMNVFSLRTSPSSWPLTCTLRAPVSPQCLVWPLPSGLPYCVTLFGSILRTRHMREYWVPGRPTEGMMTRQHHNVTGGA